MFQRSDESRRNLAPGGRDDHKAGVVSQQKGMRHGSVKKRRLKRQSVLCDVLDAELDIGLTKATKVMQLIDSLLRELAIRGNLSGKPSTFSSDVISGS
jgi:hypothetical protein